MTQMNLNSIAAKQGIKHSCSAGAAGQFRFAEKKIQKFMPEEMTAPEEADLRIMVVVSQLYNETVSNKPVFTVALHNKIKKANNNSLELPDNICEGVDVDFLLDHQRKIGLIHLAIQNKLKVEFSNALAQAIPKIDGTPDEVKNKVDDLIKLWLDTAKYMASLPNIFASV